MAKSKYKEKILEKMRVLHAELDLLADILKECKEDKGDSEDGESSTNHGS